MEGAAIVSAIAAVAGASYSVYSGERQDKTQRKAIRKQERAIAEEKAEALEKRRQQIDQQRMQLAGTGQGTRGTSTSGVKAVLGNNVLG